MNSSLKAILISTGVIGIVLLWAFGKNLEAKKTVHSTPAAARKEFDRAAFMSYRDGGFIYDHKTADGSYIDSYDKDLNDMMVRVFVSGPVGKSPDIVAVSLDCGAPGGSTSRLAGKSFADLCAFIPEADESATASDWAARHLHSPKVDTTIAGWKYTIRNGRTITSLDIEYKSPKTANVSSK